MSIKSIINNEKINEFIEFLSNNNYNKTDIGKFVSVMKKVSEWEDFMKKPVTLFSKDDILKCVADKSKYRDENNKEVVRGLVNKSRTSLRVRISYLNKVLDFLGTGLAVSTNDLNNIDFNSSENTLFTREEVMAICNSFVNAQDKFIIYALYCGICGVGYSDLREISSDDIDFENKLIHCKSGEVFKMDEYMEDIVRDTLDPIYGSVYYSSEEYVYDLDISCKYLIRIRSNIKNRKKPISVDGLQRRLKSLTMLANEALDLDIKLNGTNLKRSGMIEKMYNEKNDWKVREIKEFLKKEKLDEVELLKLFKDKYLRDVI